MPLVSQMLIHARGTRGAPRKLRDPRFMREVPTSAVDATLRRVFAELSVARPELGLPFRGVEFADGLVADEGVEADQGQGLEAFGELGALAFGFGGSRA